MSKHSYVNHEALKRRAKRAAQKKADEIKPGKYYMDGKAYESMEELMIKGFTQDEKDIMLGNNPFVKVKY